MTDLDRALLDAWHRIKPLLDANPDELNRRLARRRSPTLTRPPREWCIAVRASDHRITPWSAPLEPEGAMYLPNHDSTRYRQPHTVTLTKPLLKQLCTAVRLDAPHEDEGDVARRLGVHKGAIYVARKKGVFTTEHYKNLGGRHGKPVPVVYTRALLDPNAGRFWQRPHAVWGTHWQYLPDFVPEPFEQTIERVPFHVGTHAAVRAGALDKELFRGWRWLCPSCKVHRRVLYYPIAPVNFPELLGIDPAPPQQGSADARPDMPPCFACQQCHRVQYLSPVKRGSWNQFVAYASAGLLYGTDVKKPAWFKPERKQAYRPLPGARASVRQPQVLERLLKGWTLARIAEDLGIGKDTVGKYAQIVYRQHHVRTRVELMRVMGATTAGSTETGAPVKPEEHAVQARAAK